MLATGEVQSGSKYPKFEPLAETLERLSNNILARTGKLEFPCGLEVFDTELLGLHRGQMTILASRPKVGKTSLACQVAYFMAKVGVKVAFLSLEMPDTAILERMFCQVKKVQAWKLRDGSYIENGHLRSDVLRKLMDFMEETHAMPNLRIIDDYCRTEKQLYTLIEDLEFRPDVLILDHIQHIRANDTKMNRWDILTNYLNLLHETCLKHKIAMMILCQINRDGESAPSMANLKGTGAIEEMADQVLLMHRPQKETNIIQVNIAANRYGPQQIIKELWFDGGISRFYNSELESRMP